MKHAALIGLLCGLLLVSPVVACNPCFVHRATVVQTVITPAVPVVPVSTVFIAQFAPVSVTVPTFTVGAVSGAGYAAPGVPAAVSAGVAAPQTAPAPAPAPQQPAAAAPSENERILALLSAMEARLAVLESRLPPAQPPSADPPKQEQKAAPAPEKQSRAIPAHQPVAALGKCVSCHRGRDADGALDLSAGMDRLTTSQLSRVVARVQNGSMPPRKQQATHPPLTATELQEVVSRAYYLQQTARR